MPVDRRTFIKSGASLGAFTLANPLLSATDSAEDTPRENAADYASVAEAPYTQPFIDVDEWRDEPVRHRYVHGGFEDTDLLFSMYFPPEEQYEGRFFQPLAAVSGDENPTPEAMFMASSMAFAISSGGYLAESNQGSRHMFGGSSKANAAVARYSRALAAEMYGPHRPWGYVYGGSGGAFKTLSCVENYKGVWDGSIPYVHGSPVAIPYVFTVQAHAMRILGPRFPQIVDAIEPGGSGNMYEGLNREEREALAEVTRMGFPPRAWFDFERIAFGYTGVFSSLIGFIVNGDPGYFEDFWTKPGYLGANPTPSLREARVQQPTTIKALIMPEEARAMGLPVTISARQVGSGVTFPAALRLENLPDKELRGASIIVKSGGAKGATLYVAGRRGDIVSVGFGADSFQLLPALRAGDAVDVDNSVYLAAQTYHRHQVQAPEFKVFDQFRGPSGTPIYPQRPHSINESADRVGDTATQSGQFDGKMIVVHAMMDEAAYPWQADWYRARVAATQGARFDDKYRLYYVDHAMHTTRSYNSRDGMYPAAQTRVVSYQGVLQQALRHLADWVEEGIAPPASTGYTVNDGQVLLAPEAGDRKGLQPVVRLSVNGGDRIEVKTGEEVEFEAVIESPPNAGLLVSAKWDFDGKGEFPESSAIDSPARRLTLKKRHTFTEAGSYFPSLLVSSELDGRQDAAYARPENLGRVRVVVS